MLLPDREFVDREMNRIVIDLLCMCRAQPDAIRCVLPLFGRLQRDIAGAAWRRCLDVGSNADVDDLGAIAKRRAGGMTPTVRIRAGVADTAGERALCC